MRASRVCKSSMERASRSPRRQCRVGKTPHRCHLRLIWGEQPIRVLAGSQMNAIAHVQQCLDLVVIPAVRSVGKP